MSDFVILNFGTFPETNRFKALALSRGFLSGDAMDRHPPGALVKTGGIRRTRSGGAETLSLYGLKTTVWQGRVGGKTFSSTYKTWFESVIKGQVECIYIAGHHWAYRHYLHASWGEKSEFHVRFNLRDQRLEFGAGSRISIATDGLRSSARLIIGFGCNVASPQNSRKYQTFFRPSRPIVLGWDRTIGIPKERTGVSVNARFFDYLDRYAKSHPKVPKTKRLTWFYNQEPMELVKAWGHATIPWRQRQARARAKDGTFYRFKLDKNGVAIPVVA